MLSIRPLLVSLLFIPISAVWAVPLTFFGEDLNGNPTARIAFPNSAAARASFLSQLSAIATDNLEEFSNGMQLPITLTFPGAASASLNGPAGTIQTSSGGTNGFGRFPTSRSNYLETDAAAITLTFAVPVTSFGFYGTDIGDFGGQLTLVFSGAQKVTETVPHSLGTGARSPQDGSVLFFGTPIQLTHSLPYSLVTVPRMTRLVLTILPLEYSEPRRHRNLVRSRCWGPVFSG